MLYREKGRSDLTHKSFIFIVTDATVPENESKAPVVIKTEDPGTSASVSEPSTSARKKASKSEGAIKNGRSGRSGREKEEEKSTG